MKKIFICGLIFLSFSSFGQTNKNKPTEKKTSNPTKLEIDRIAEKYKDSSSIILFTSHGNILADVTVNKNVDRKPESVLISAQDPNDESAGEFLSQLIAQKKKQGFKYTDGGEVPETSPNDIIEILNFRNTYEMFLERKEVSYTYKKGNKYFVVKIGSHWQKGDILDRSKITRLSSWFSIESGDNSRKGGTKSTKFDF